MNRDLKICEDLDHIAGETVITYTVIDGKITIYLSNNKSVTFTGLETLGEEE